MPDNNHHSLSTHTKNSDLLLQDRIDLLVEGELTSQQKSSLLQELDANPDGWRIVAFAFIEHQALSQSIRSACDGEQRSPIRSSEPIATRRVEKRSIHLSGWNAMLSLALVGLLAFFGGWLSSQSVPPGDASALATPGGDAITAPEVAPPMKEPDEETTDAPSSVVQSNPPENANLNLSIDGISIVGYVEWVGNHGKQLSPVFEGGQINQEWLAAHPPRINSDIQRKAARAGWEIEPARKMVSLTLGEGSKFTIPMDDVTYRYVGPKVF